MPLDVTSDQSVTAAAELVQRRAGRLDALVNNAGISGEMAPGWIQDPTTADLDEVRRVLETNVLGVIRVTNAMLPLLRQAASPRIVNLSSSVASLTWQSDPDVEVGPLMGIYAPTKSYLNAVTVQYARHFSRHEHPDQRGLPGPGRDRLHRLPGAPYARAGRGRGDPFRHAARRRPFRVLRPGRGRHSLVTRAAGSLARAQVDEDAAPVTS